MPQRGAPQFGASLPHDRRRERPVGPGQFHSERRIRAGRVVPPGRCGFAMVRRSGGATARPLESIWASLPHDRRRERPVGPGQFHSERRSERAVWCLPGGADLPWCAAAGAQLPGHWIRFGPLCRMIAAGRGPSDRASFIQRGESERAVWCLPGGADLPWCAAAGAQLPGHWIRFGASLPHDRRRERTPFHSERRIRAGQWCLPGGADLPWCAAAGAQLPGHWSRFGPLCRMIAAGRGPSDRAVWCLPGGADLPWCAAAGAQLPGHWIRFGPLCRMIAAGRGPSDRAECGASRAVRICHGAPQRGRNCPATGFDLEPLCLVGPGHVVPPGGADLVRRSGGATARPLDSSLSAASPPGEARRTGPVSFREANQSGPCGASRAVRICHGAPQRGRNCPATGFDLEPLCRMIGAGRGPSDRAMWCLPGGADLPWCAAAGAQLPGHWIRFGASLPHDRRRERPVGPGQFHSERRIRAGRVVPPGRCGFAMVRRSGGATARPLDSIWSLSAAWSPPGEARRTGPVSFREANQSGPCGASRAVRICHGAPQRGRNCPATGVDLEPLCRMIGAGRGPSDRAMWCLPGGADLPWCAAAGAQLPGHWSRFGPLCRMVAAGRGPSDRASFIQRGESERAVWCLPGGADLPWCAAAGAQLPGHWIRFGASLPHGRRRERPVGPGQFHSERRIRAGRVVPPGRCGFAMVRRSGGATARPLDSIWSLSVAWSPLLSTGPIAGQQQRLRTGIEPPR